MFIGGASPAFSSSQNYSQKHYEAVCVKYGDPALLDKYETIFIDSITVAGRLCLQWCKNQQQAFSEKTGKEDMRGAYGLHGQEMISWLMNLQHTREKNIWFIGILEERLDEYNRKHFAMQIDGSKTANELPGIVDQVITMAQIKAQDGSNYRAFVNHTVNPYGYPAKERSGRLEMIEDANLGKLMEKIRGEKSYSNCLRRFFSPRSPKGIHSNYSIS